VPLLKGPGRTGGLARPWDAEIHERIGVSVASSDRSAVYLWFIKFCEREEYADQFMRGSLYLNPLSYFRKLKGTRTYLKFVPHINVVP
jgi:hypothetical protein